MPIPGAVGLGLGLGWGREQLPARVEAGPGKPTRQVKCNRVEPCRAVRFMRGGGPRPPPAALGCLWEDPLSHLFWLPPGPPPGAGTGLFAASERAAMSSAECSRPGSDSESSLLPGPGASPEAAAGLCRVPLTPPKTGGSLRAHHGFVPVPVRARCRWAGYPRSFLSFA